MLMGSKAQVFCGSIGNELCKNLFIRYTHSLLYARMKRKNDNHLMEI